MVRPQDKQGLLADAQAMGMAELNPPRLKKDTEVGPSLAGTNTHDVSGIQSDYNTPEQALNFANAGDGSGPQGRWYHSAFHITTVIIGTGVLGLPHAMSQLTWIPGLIIMGMMYFASYFTALLLSKMHFTKVNAQSNDSRRRLNTYYEVGEYVFGKTKTLFLVVPFQYIVLMGSCIAYLIAAGETINGLYKFNCTDCAPIRQYMLTLAVAVLELLLCFFPSLESVSFISALAATASLGYCVISVSLCIHLGQQEGVQYGLEDNSMTNKVFETFTGISVVAFAFGCHSVLPEIQATLRSHPSPETENIKGVSVSWLLVLMLYFSSAVAGYWAFGRDVQANILKSIEAADTSSLVRTFLIIAQVLVVIHVVIAYQVLAMPIYGSLEGLISKAMSPGTFTRHFRLIRTSIRFTFIALTGFVAIALPFFGDVMALFGALGLTPLSFVLPPALYLTYYRRTIGCFAKGTCWVTLALGVVVGVAGTLCSIREIVLDASTFETFA